ncbi:MAG: OPT/YSL family transporter [Candidatus Thermoplasmatota archaeon]|jgi:uncharacterized oligopeptide transporter (OPT) family protein|nr:OPT/YSL family transporter [Candidatus Thermoplasmatota archaeon]MDP7264972.1 OPT/YSL family transporter [Candidatus Thermoplasmatota archaeon]
MGKVLKSAYRKPVTPGGLKKIEEGTLRSLDPEMFANFNTGVCEQYLEEENRKNSFVISKWNWKMVIISIIIGSLFAMINQYVGLKVGMVVSGSWYVIYLLGLALKWDPPQLNIAATAGNGAAMICVGFVFSFPAIYLLAMSPTYEKTGGGFLTYVPPTALLFGAFLATVIAGLLGIFYFIIFRRIWLVEDPLPTPSFEGFVQLMSIAKDVTSGAKDQAMKSIKTVTVWIGGTMVLTFIKDFPLFKAGGTSRVPLLDSIFGGRFYNHGDLTLPATTPVLGKYTVVNFSLMPIQFGIGWFMKFKTALIISMGTLVSWLIIIPAAVLFDLPVYIPTLDNMVNLSSFPIEGISGAAMIAPEAANVNIAKVIAIGAILGGGFTGLIKMAPVFKTATADLFKTKGDETVQKDFVPNKGWYEWPVSHIKIMVIVTFVAVFLIFGLSSGGYWLNSFFLALLLVSTTFFIGAIAVKVMGECGTEPVSATSFIVLMLIVFTFKLLNVLHLTDTSNETIVLLSIIGVTVFGGAISMSGDIILMFKVGGYVGNRPFHLVKAVTLGILPGAAIAAFFAVLFSRGLALPIDHPAHLDLLAPQANAFAKFVQVLISGNVSWWLLLLGVLIGIFVELLIGMGTAFGLGMYFPLGLGLILLVGGGARDLWEKYYLEPKAKELGWGDKEKTLALLQSYMMATGLIVGEALMGTIVALYLVFPLVM